MKRFACPHCGATDRMHVVVSMPVLHEVTKWSDDGHVLLRDQQWSIGAGNFLPKQEILGLFCWVCKQMSEHAIPATRATRAMHRLWLQHQGGKA